jgi:drug/metabolite transporter (DMT)-like permease
MSAKDGAMLLALSAIWGGAFLFMRVGAPVLGPIALIEARVSIAGVTLLLCALALRKGLDLRARWRQYLVVGILNSAIPFTLIAAAELRLTAGLAAILNATSPLFGAIVAALWMNEALTLKKVVGLLLGLVGVALVVGWSPLPFSVALALSVAASLTAAIFYGVASVYTKVHVQGASPLALSTGSQLGAALFLVPFTAAVPPQHAPGLEVIVAVVSLGLVCTAAAYLIYFRLIANIGPTRALTVTFLAPVFGIFWGVLLLREPLTWTTVLGFGIILTGTGFVTGVLGRRKAQSAPAQPSLSEQALPARELEGKRSS